MSEQSAEEHLDAGGFGGNLDEEHLDRFLDTLEETESDRKDSEHSVEENSYLHSSELDPEDHDWQQNPQRNCSLPHGVISEIGTIFGQIDRIKGVLMNYGCLCASCVSLNAALSDIHERIQSLERFRCTVGPTSPTASSIQPPAPATNTLDRQACIAFLEKAARMKIQRDGVIVEDRLRPLERPYFATCSFNVDFISHDDEQSWKFGLTPGVIRKLIVAMIDYYEGDEEVTSLQSGAPRSSLKRKARSSSKSNLLPTITLPHLPEAGQARRFFSSEAAAFAYHHLFFDILELKYLSHLHHRRHRTLRHILRIRAKLDALHSVKSEAPFLDRFLRQLVEEVEETERERGLIYLRDLALLPLQYVRYRFISENNIAPDGSYGAVDDRLRTTYGIVIDFQTLQLCQEILQPGTGCVLPELTVDTETVPNILRHHMGRGPWRIIENVPVLYALNHDKMLDPAVRKGPNLFAIMAVELYEPSSSLADSAHSPDSSMVLSAELAWPGPVRALGTVGETRRFVWRVDIDVGVWRVYKSAHDIEISETKFVALEHEEL